MTSLVLLLFFTANFWFVACQHKSSFESVQDADYHLHNDQIPPPYQQPSKEDILKILGDVFDNGIDKDNDDLVTDKELKEWVEAVHNKLIKESVDRQWSFYEPDYQEVHSWDGYKPETKEVLRWDRYVNLTYPDNLLEADESDPQVKNLKMMYKRAERRWKFADRNEDTVLIKQEFKDFVHPEESERSREVLVQEAIEDMDKDDNGDISLEEYINHLTEMTSEEERSDPNWSQVQQNHFTTFLDKNKDGTLNNDELKEWLVPSYDRHEAEAWRLISVGDHNNDNKLAKEEILNNHEEFLTLIPVDFWSRFNEEHTTTATVHDEF